MAEKRKSGIFGGIAEPLGWAAGDVPSFGSGDKNDNPFFSQPAVSGPAKPIEPEARAVLNTAMEDWYKAGKPSPFKNVPQQQASSRASGLDTLSGMSFPGLDMEALQKVPQSPNIEDRRNERGLSKGTMAKVESYNSGAAPESNSLETIKAALGSAGGPLQPVLATPASGRIYKTGDDPIAELSAQRSSFDPLGFMLGLFGGPKLSPKIFAGRSPPVGISVTSPNTTVFAGKPVNPMDLSMTRADQIWNTANEGGTAFTKAGMAKEIEAEKAQMIKDALGTNNVVPLKPGLAKGNIRNQSEDEMIATLTKKWDDIAKGTVQVPWAATPPPGTPIGPTPSMLSAQAGLDDTLKLIQGGLKGKPNLTVAVDNTAKSLQIKDQQHLNQLIANAEGDADLAAIKAALVRQGMVIPRGLE